MNAFKKSGLISAEEDDSDGTMDCDRPTLADSELLQLFHSDTEDEEFLGFMEDDLPVP